MKNCVVLSCIVIFLGSFLQNGSAKPQAVTCGSSVKLMNSQHKVRLHSHDVKYGSGSGQQSVTGTVIKEDVNSHWTIKGPGDKDHCTRGEPVECGQKVRLEHLTTHRNLHSHHFSSPPCAPTVRSSPPGPHTVRSSSPHPYSFSQIYR